MTVGDPVPPALAVELQRSWATVAAAPALSWEEARAMLARLQAGGAAGGGSPGAVAAATAAAQAASAGDIRSAAAALVAPLVAEAEERHRALISGGGAGASAAAATVPSLEAAVGFVGGGGGADAAAAAASLVCFRETLLLDASSGFDGGSYEPRVTLEFRPDRLAAATPSLGGDWGRRLLERLMAPPAWSDRLDPVRRSGSAGPGQPRPTRGSRLDPRAASRQATGSQAWRRRHGAAARSAAMAAMFPLDVEARYCRRTGTAFLSTARYGSREANRKLLLEHYARLLRALAEAAAARSG
ncbi:hypothetical protein GPECTOR_55g320 [Gonium pectorale]|uniref:Uncharacterized protein n=1 Tax=Gonium pectorale TaxID=33097 RepID=A0A150G6F8_GONPE|nr:hypothetical protein GPECTOR_55g320 [Gonium pectorale]|eukprot:KXZ45414.1 hypothetical protein GPECTOR_55g320 [Gonium pectorale]